MLPSNIEKEVREILEKNGGWLRVEECAKEYAKGDDSRRTRFYRWRKRIKKGKVEGFQVVELPGNVVFIGLKSADPNKVLKSVISDEKTAEKMRRFFNRFRGKKEPKELFSNAEAATFAHYYQHETRYMRNFSKLYIWLRRGARPEEKPELED